MTTAKITSELKENWLYYTILAILAYLILKNFGGVLLFALVLLAVVYIISQIRGKK